jgi:phenylacetyl-CoA:acceptor oxidoreductase 27-kDa subunit
MTRWAIVADLRRCVGCQTCTAACKQANGTPPGVQWRRVLDLETGEYPAVKRAFVPVGCMHCDEPPCMHVCPSTATRKRADGIVTIDYELCIGCGYCMVACPYDARAKVDGVATKCTFCVDRVDAGLAQGLTPGVDHEATPACVNSCIAKALHFGDADDAESNISSLLAENQSFRMHEDLETGPNIYYLWDKAL